MQPNFLLALRLTLLQVFLEGWSRRNGLAGVLVYVGFRIAGISHASLSKFLVDGSCASDRSGRGKSRGGGHEGGEDGKLVLWLAHEPEKKRKETVSNIRIANSGRISG
jgi:hypothetical protein